MARLLLIVSRTEPARVTYFKHVFGGETADVITDRRIEERRQRRERVAAERRREDRRRRDITKDLQTNGWAAVRSWARQRSSTRHLLRRVVSARTGEERRTAERYAGPVKFFDAIAKDGALLRWGAQPRPAS